MQASCVPCSSQVRVRYTFEGVPDVFQTSAGADRWQTGQRDVVCLRVCLREGSSIGLIHKEEAGTKPNRESDDTFSHKVTQAEQGQGSAPIAMPDEA